jgi:hypothetical protein
MRLAAQHGSVWKPTRARTSEPLAGSTRLTIIAPRPHRKRADPARERRAGPEHTRPSGGPPCLTFG